MAMGMNEDQAGLAHDGVELAFETWRHFEGAAVVCVNGYRVK
jgi:hypothetical protein